MTPTTRIKVAWHKTLSALKPCEDGYRWALTHKTFREAWATCERGDWILWYMGRRCKTLAQRKKLVLAACSCARLALKYVPEGDNRPLTAINTAERWAKGDSGITLEDVRDAANAAPGYAEPWRSHRWFRQGWRPANSRR